MMEGHFEDWWSVGGGRGWWSWWSSWFGLRWDGGGG